MSKVSLLGLPLVLELAGVYISAVKSLQGSYGFQSPFYHCDHILRGKCYHCLRQDVEHSDTNSQIKRSK